MAGLILAAGVAASCLLATWTFRLANRWGGAADRRMLVLWAMAVPATVLGVLLGGSVGMVLQACPLFGPADQIVVAAVAGVFIALVALACVRQTAQALRVRREILAVSEPMAEGPLFDKVADLAAKLGMAPPHLRLARTSQPLACSLGFRRRVVVLSTGLVAGLDDRECEAVIAHELAHLKQNDHVVGFLIAWLRDSLFFVPASREGWEHYRHDREIACDAMSAGATGRPGALASALFKVGGGSIGAEGAAIPADHAAHFGHGGAGIEARLSHLLGEQPATARRAAVGYGILAVGAMATILALSPIWYMPVCMTVFCHFGG